MREKAGAGPPGGRFPAQRIAERRDGDRDHPEIGLTGAVLRGALPQLRRGGEMQEAVAPVVGGTVIGARRLGVAPVLATDEGVDGLLHGGEL